jgi:hypothetical protein
VQVARFTGTSPYRGTREGLHADASGHFLVGGLIPLPDDAARAMALDGQLEWVSVEYERWAAQRLGLPSAAQSKADVEDAVAGVDASTIESSNGTSPARTHSSRKTRALVIGGIAVVLAAGLSAGGWWLYQQSQPDAQARRGALRTVKAVGAALVAGDVAALDKQVLSRRDIALLTIAETAPGLMSQSDETLVNAFDTAMSKNRLFANVGETLAGMREGDTTWFYSIDNNRICFLSNSGVEGKKRVVVLVRTAGEWRLAYWTPPMTSSQWEAFLDMATPLDDPTRPLPEVQEVLSAAGMSYDRSTTSVEAPAAPSAVPNTATGTRRTAPSDATNDGLYVQGLCLNQGVPQSKVMSKFGTEEERYGDPGAVSYRWTLSDGTYLTVEFDSIGAVRNATLAVPDDARLDSSTYAIVEEAQVLLRQDTLGDVMIWFPDGELDELVPGEGTYLRDYTVFYGGEATEEMRFGVSWDMEDKDLAAQKALKISAVTVGDVPSD